jgi:carbon storage regulator CsrA
VLVLTRKTQQQIQIGDNIRITILQVKGKSVRVGIEAPRDLRITRQDASSAAAPEATTHAAVTQVAESVAPGVAPTASNQHHRLQPYFSASPPRRSDLKTWVTRMAARRAGAAVAEVPLPLPAILAAHAAC